MSSTVGKKIKRDLKNNAVLVDDNDALSAYRKRKKHSGKIDEIEKRIDGMEDKLDRILELLNDN